VEKISTRYKIFSGFVCYFPYKWGRGIKNVQAAPKKYRKIADKLERFNTRIQYD